MGKGGSVHGFSAFQAQLEDFQDALATGYEESIFVEVEGAGGGMQGAEMMRYSLKDVQAFLMEGSPGEGLGIEGPDKVVDSSSRFFPVDTGIAGGEFGGIRWIWHFWLGKGLEGTEG